MKPRIWIINQYSSSPATGMGGRSFYLSKELAALGYDVTLVSGSYSHLLRVIPETEGQFTQFRENGFRNVLVRTLKYPSARNPRRVLNWFLFSWALTRLRSVLGDSPDVVMFSSPSPIGFLGAKKLASDAKAALVFDVRDIWPLTLTELGGVSVKHPLIRSMSAVEKSAYRDSDLVTSNLLQSVDHMVSRGMDKSKFRWIPNGVLLSEVENPEPLSPELLSRWPKGKFVINYTGTIGMANKMDVFVEAAKRLSHRKDIHFVMVGKGAKKAELKQSVQDQGLSNVHFFDAVPKSQVQSILALSDVLYVGSSNEPIYRFGIGANKIPEYMYAQRPVLMSYGGGLDPVRVSGAGIVVPPEDPEALAKACVELADTSQEKRDEMGRKGRAYALEHFSYTEIAKRLGEEFTALVDPSKRKQTAPKVQFSKVG